MSLRKFATVDRGLVDHPPVCVFAWEIPILEAIYGNVEVHTIEELTNTKGSLMANKIKLRHAEQHAPDLKTQLITMSNAIPDEVDPINSPETEYERLRGVYGGHPEVAAASIEVAYGRFNEGRFTKAVQEAYASMNAELGIKTGESGEVGNAIDVDAVKALDPKEVKAALTEWGVKFGQKEANVLLGEKYLIIKALKEDDTLDFNVNESIENLRIMFDNLPESEAVE
jgi:hypothetical protein